MEDENEKNQRQKKTEVPKKMAYARHAWDLKKKYMCKGLPTQSPCA